MYILMEADLDKPDKLSIVKVMRNASIPNVGDTVFLKFKEETKIYGIKSVNRHYDCENNDESIYVLGEYITSTENEGVD